MPKFTAEESIHKVDEIYRLSLMDKNTPYIIGILPASVIIGPRPSCLKRCEDEYVNCTSSAVDDVDNCMCGNEYRLCRGRCTGYPAILHFC